MALFIDAIRDIASHEIASEVTPLKTIAKPEFPVPIYVYNINECFEHETIKIPIKDAVGKTSAETMTACPPGCIVIDIWEID